MIIQSIIGGFLLVVLFGTITAGVTLTSRLKKNNGENTRLLVHRNLAWGISTSSMVLLAAFLSFIAMERTSFLSLMEWTWKLGGILVGVTLYSSTDEIKKLQEVRSFPALYQELVQHLLPFALVAIGITLTVVGLFLPHLG